MLTLQGSDCCWVNRNTNHNETIVAILVVRYTELLYHTVP